MGSIAKVFVVLLVSGMVGACTSAGKTLVLTESAAAIPADKTVALSVRSMAGEADDQAVRLRDALAARLVADGIFQDVVEPPAESDYAMDVMITATRDATGARIAFGFFAPRNYMTVEVKLRDRARDELLASFTSTGYGARSWMTPQGYGMDDPLREIADQVVSALR